MERIDYPALNESVYRHELPNGLQIYVLVRPEYGKQFAFFAARYGGMNLRFRGGDGHWVDTPAGVAHFLEHKMFDTEDGSATQTLAANGAVDNAFTSADMTGYYFEGTRGFEENLKTLLSFVSVPYFTTESVEKEQGIIGQEIRMCDDDPENQVYYQLLETMYGQHPIRVRVVGSQESIADITPELLYQCHAAFYRPGNMVLCVAGNVDPDRVAQLAQEILPKERSGAADAEAGREEPLNAACSYAECRMPVSVPLFELGFKGTPAPAGQRLRQRLVAELACDVLFGASAPLYNRLYEEGLINNSFDSLYDSVPGCAYLMAGGESRDPERVMEEALQEAARLAEEGISPQLWDRLRRAAYGSMVKRLNSLEDTCIELTQGHFDGEEYFRFPELFHSIEWPDVAELLRSWCVREQAALSVVWPLEDDPGSD